MEKTLKSIHFLVLMLYFSTAYNNCNAQSASQSESRSKNIIYFDLPGQKLVDSVLEFSIQSDIDIVVPVIYIEKYYSSPVIGPFSLEQALKLLLGDAPLKYQFTEGGTLIVISPLVNNDEKVVLKDTTEDIGYEEVIVKNVQYPFRYASIANSLTHGSVHVFDSARYINILPKQLIADQQPLELNDLLKYSSSITPGDGYADSNDDFYIRSFPRHAIYIDGFRLENTVGTKILPDLIDRIEIIKGPSTLYYGQAEPGGVVNVIRKKPLPQSHQKLSFSLGGDEIQRVSMDVNGQIIEDSSDLGYRFIYANEQRDVSRLLNDTSRELVSASFNWQISHTTEVNVNFDYQHSSFSRVIDNWYSEENISEEQVEEVDDAPDFSSTYALGGVNITHYFDNDWMLQIDYFNYSEDRSGFRGLSSTFVSSNSLTDNVEVYHRLFSDNLRLNFLEPISGSNKFSSAIVIDAFPDEVSESKTDYIRLGAEGSPTYFGLTHHLMLGLDSYYSEASEILTQARISPPDTINSVGYLGGQPRFLESLLAIDSYNTQYRHLRYREHGVYVQDTMELGKHWVASLGGRLLSTRGETNNQEVAPGAIFQSQEAIQLKKFERFAKQFGLVYKPMDNYSLYVNYSEAVKTNYQVDNIGSESALPELSDQLEIGIKALWLHGQLLSTFSLFDINKENVLRAYYFRGEEDSSGKRNTKGLNLDMTYQLNSHIDILSSISWLDPKIVSDDMNNGNTPAQVSKETASLFFNYRFAGSTFNGLSLNFGGHYVGKRFADNENTETSEGSVGSSLSQFSQPLPSYVVFDFGTSYTFNIGKVKNQLRLAVRNIADNQYDYSAAVRLRRTQGQGRHFFFTYNVEL